MNKKLSRRQMMRILAGGASGLLLSDLLVACAGGGNSGGNNNGSSGTATVSGNVNMAQMGGSNLTINSATAAAAPIAKGGAFTTNISANGSQLQCVTDGSGIIWALAISNPSSADPLTIDATSTALALLMLTPGILTTTPSETTQRIGQLQALSSFSALESYLATNLPTTSLQDLLAQATLPQLISTCVSDWMNTSTSSAQNAHILATSTDGSFSANFTMMPIVNPSSASVALTNSAWRFVQVARTPYDANVPQNQLLSPQFANTDSALPSALSSFIPSNSGYIIGPVPLSWGSIFTRTANNPIIVQDTNINLTVPPNQASLVYIAQGIGWASQTSQAPFGLPNGASNAIGVLHSVVYYVVFPFLDLMLGAQSLFENYKLLGILGNLLAGVNSVADNISTILTTASSSQDIQSAILDICITTFGLITLAANKAIISAAGIAITPALALILGIIAAAFGAANVAVALSNWTLLPPVSTVSLPISGANIIVS